MKKVFLIILLGIVSCKKEDIPHGLIPIGTHVWVRWQDWSGGHYNKDGDDDLGFDVRDYWVVDSVVEINLAITGSPTYFCHDQRGQSLDVTDFHAIEGVPPNTPHYHPIEWIESELQLNPSSEPFFDDLIHHKK